MIIELNNKLKEVIIAQRLVKEGDLDLLFEETKKANNVNEGDYTKMIDEIKSDIGYGKEE